MNQVHSAQRAMLIRDIIDKMRHDGCGGRAGKAELLTGIEGVSSRPGAQDGAAPLRCETIHSSRPSRRSITASKCRALRARGYVVKGHVTRSAQAPRLRARKPLMAPKALRAAATKSAWRGSGPRGEGSEPMPSTVYREPNRDEADNLVPACGIAVSVLYWWAWTCGSPSSHWCCS